MDTLSMVETTLKEVPREPEHATLIGRLLAQVQADRAQHAANDGRRPTDAVGPWVECEADRDGAWWDVLLSACCTTRLDARHGDGLYGCAVTALEEWALDLITIASRVRPLAGIDTSPLGRDAQSLDLLRRLAREREEARA